MNTFPYLWEMMAAPQHNIVHAGGRPSLIPTPEGEAGQGEKYQLVFALASLQPSSKAK